MFSGNRSYKTAKTQAARYCTTSTQPLTLSSTTDQLVLLETFVREAFIHKQHAVAIFFDLEKAYDTAWKYDIMKDLFDAGLRGRLPVFISNFLRDR